ncbi:MAG: FHA domain-containing protein [Chloroflexi bacterium]|nr:FHA domain-containing protein [Chloroflexota bacterium]
MPAYLIVNTQVYPINSSPLTIGRSLEANIVIQEPTVSRIHAEITRSEDIFTLHDLGSTGGTYLNGKRISQSTLHSGDSILLAGTPIVFVQDAPQLESRSARSTGPLFPPSPDEEPTIRENKPIWRLDDNSD